MMRLTEENVFGAQEEDKEENDVNDDDDDDDDATTSRSCECRRGRRSQHWQAIEILNDDYNDDDESRYKDKKYKSKTPKRV